MSPTVKRSKTHLSLSFTKNGDSTIANLTEPAGGALPEKNKTNNARRMIVKVSIIKEFIILTLTIRFEDQIEIVTNPNSKSFYFLLTHTLSRSLHKLRSTGIFKEVGYCN